jgi:hypothetical protein
MGDIMTIDSEICVEGEFRIAADGTWFHENAPIGRAELVRLFSTVLVRDAEGAYWLQTKAEKVPVLVEDAPFVGIELDAKGTGDSQVLRLRTNIDRWVCLGADHPLIMRGTEAQPRPYIGLEGGLEALVARTVYYRLADLAIDRVGGHKGPPGVWSQGHFFPLAPPAPEDTL